METILERREYVDNIVSTSKAIKRRVVAERRTRELKKRVRVTDLSQGSESEESEKAVEFLPEMIDVDSVKIVQLGRGN